MVSAHFKRHEFACKCGCGFYAVDIELLFVLEDVREHFGGRRLHIISGCRCADHNANTPGASKKSRHIFGIAADFWIEGISADEVADYLEEKYPDIYGIGRYDDRTHIDVRGRMTRWDKRTKKGGKADAI
jgi:uncharacterized protein YcbK (DUF882 family)